MIRYDIDPEDLQARVEQQQPGWIDRARARTDTFRNAGMYTEERSIWSEIKPVFMDLQADKCAFCERRFESGTLGRYELDLEHFRPKRNVKAWRCPPLLINNGVSLTPPPGANRGYYLLAYHLLNYAAACKVCNSGLKKNYFPISGPYDLPGSDPEAMDAERPWLLYPIGRLDADPEEVITFYGILPRCEAADQRLKQRGLVTIAFFGLDDVFARKNLMKERARVILLLHAMLSKTEQGDVRAAALVDAMLAPTAPHANCARSFSRLFHSNRHEANDVLSDVERFLASGSP